MTDHLYGGGVDEIPTKWPTGLHPPSAAEVAMWRRLWTETPQAHWIWSGMFVETQSFAVAVLARSLVAAENPAAGANLLGSVVEVADALLLTPKALRRHGFAIDDDKWFPPLMDVITRVGETPTVRDGWVANHGVIGV